MTALAGPLHLIALVLIISGAQKLLSPEPAATAMRSAGLTVPTGAGAVLGAIEIATGLAVLAVPTEVTAAWLGVFYLSLAGFVVVLRRRDATAACGCFGAGSAPPSWAHVVVNACSAAVAGASVVLGVGDIAAVAENLAIAVPYLALLCTGAVLVLVGPGLLAQAAQHRSAQHRASQLARPFGPVR